MAVMPNSNADDEEAEHRASNEISPNPVASSRRYQPHWLEQALRPQAAQPTGLETQTSGHPA